DDLGFFHEAAQHAVFRPLCIDEIPAVNARCRLELAVDAAVALFEAARIPREVEVKQVPAMALEVQTLPRGVGRDQDAQWIVSGWCVEGPLDLLAPIKGCGAAEHGDALFGALGVRNGLAQQPLDPTPCILVLGEN